MVSSGSSSFTWTLPDSDDKDKRKPQKVRNRPGQTVTVQGDPGEPPSVGLPTSQNGILIPYIIGRQRIYQPNVLWYGNLDIMYETETEVISQEVQEEDDGGVTIRTPVTTIQETEYVSGYRMDVHLGLCLGPDIHLLELYIDNARKWQGDASGARTVISASSISSQDFWADFIFYDGRFNQDFSTGTEVTIDVNGYVGVAILSLSGANATEVFPAISAEVGRWPNPLGLDADVNVNADKDINPMTAAYDIQSNPWGAAGLDAPTIDNVSFTAAAVRLAEEGNFISVYNQTQTSAAEMLKEIENQIYGFIFLDPEVEKVKVKLVRWDLYDHDNLPLFDESNISNLRDFTKRSWVGSATKSVASFTSREKGYDPDYVMAQSPMISGSLKEADTAKYDYPLSQTGEVASKCLARDMILFNQPSWRGEMQVNRKAANLLPGDAFHLSWAEYNISLVPMVVTNRRELAGDVGIIIEFSELINVNGEVLYSIPEPSLFNPTDKSPVSPIDAKVISAPYWVQVWAGYNDRIWNKRIKVCTPLYLVEAYNKLQVSYDVRMLNYPNYESVNVGDEPVINRAALYASTANLVAEMDQYDGWADGIIDELIVNGVIRERYFKSVDLEGVKGGELFMIIDDEILSFEAAQNESGGVWTLTNVHRGLLDTAPATHAAGAEVWVINGNWTDRIGMSFDIVPEYIPELQFCSRTIDDRQKDDGLQYSDWEPDNRVNCVLRPVDTRIDGVRGTGAALNVATGATIDVSWKTRSRNKIRKVAVFADAAHAPEVVLNGTWQTHKVWLTDFDGDDYDLGETSASPADANSLDVTIPSGVALGVGYIWVQALGAFGDAIQAERYKVNIT